MKKSWKLSPISIHAFGPDLEDDEAIDVDYDDDLDYDDEECDGGIDYIM